ncbi:twin-arginine translocase TatA/TatE family subunit [Curtobacterium sp. ISL-83]|uniref:twin-arginine translocase TatA/TatE family subunit n=1 Tax=Curtobacterium sp. ISL-83 TaxID=2819145 RepID=UPI001BE92886|nr:twin-arginine translocase TatA/TatE family subunit [Curtobacterium sp. ISL-83]MBT2502648.1 twin-arginine translocase TatA/TatE family subunit [Curtobacterium sp. ISL-83]
MWQGLGGIHLLIILGIIILLFGATKLPALAKGLGQSINIFKKEMATDDKAVKPEPGVQTTTAYTAPVEPAAQPVVNPGPSVQPNTDPRQ